MLRAFDGSFWAGTAFVAVALAIVAAVATSTPVPVLGSGRLALLAVGALGLAACMSVGSGTAVVDGKTVFDVTAPATLVGTAFGLLSFAIVVVGLIGFEPILRPVGQFLPGAVATGEGAVQRIAIVALGGVIAAKWLIGLALTTLHVLKVA
jgi:hypothetical protein